MKNNIATYVYAPRSFPLGPETTPRELTRIAEMGFTDVYLMPVWATINGSSYAPDYGEAPRYDPRCFAEGADPEAELHRFVKVCKDLGLRPGMDLVLGHAYVDGEMVMNHPDYFAWENGKVGLQFCDSCVYEDIARFDYEHHAVGDDLFQLALRITRHWVEMGFRFFRCDMANHLDPRMWQYVIGEIHQTNPEIDFWAESFGPADLIAPLADAGFSHYYNSNYFAMLEGFETGDWFEEQNHRFSSLGLKSVSIASNHDQPRLMATLGSPERVEAAIKLMAWLTNSFSINALDEYGVEERYNVFTTDAYDPAKTPPRFDFQPVIKEALAAKAAHPALQEEKFTVTRYSQDLIVFHKRAENEKADILVNLSPRNLDFTFARKNYHLKPFEVRLAEQLPRFWQIAGDFRHYHQNNWAKCTEKDRLWLHPAADDGKREIYATAEPLYLEAGDQMKVAYIDQDHDAYAWQSAVGFDALKNADEFIPGDKPFGGEANIKCNQTGKYSIVLSVPKDGGRPILHCQRTYN